MAQRQGAETTDSPTIREQLLAGATAHVREHGVADLSTRSLAAAGGRSTMCLYTKFSSRQGLLDAVHEELGDALVAALSAAADPARAYWDFGVDEPGEYAFLIGADPVSTGVDPRRRAELIDRLCAVLDPEPQGRGRRWALLHGMIALQQAGHDLRFEDVAAGL